MSATPEERPSMFHQVLGFAITAAEEELQNLARQLFDRRDRHVRRTPVYPTRAV